MHAERRAKSADLETDPAGADDAGGLAVQQERPVCTRAERRRVAIHGGARETLGEVQDAGHRVFRHRQGVARTSCGRHGHIAAPQITPQQIAGARGPLMKPFELRRPGTQIEREWPAAQNYKAMIEIPPKFAGRPPVNPVAQAELARGGQWNGKGAQGLAADVRYYGKWMRDEAEKRIGHLYPKVTVTAEMAKDRPDLTPFVGQDLTVIAWLWARTVKSPNPAFADVDVPLISTFMLSTKPGKEAYVEPILENVGARPVDLAPSRGDLVGRAQLMAGKPGYRFTVKMGRPAVAEAAKNGTKLGRGANFKCLMSGSPIAGDYIRAEGKARRIGARLMGIVSPRGHVGVSIWRRPQSTRRCLCWQNRNGSRTLSFSSRLWDFASAITE